MDSQTDIHEQVRKFFDFYALQFDECNWPEFIALYCEPALSVRADGSVKLMNTHAEVLEFFRHVSDTWRIEGYSSFATSNLNVKSLGSRSVLATFTWHMQRANGSLIRAWQQSYQLIVVGQNWRVLASTFHAP